MFTQLAVSAQPPLSERHSSWSAKRKGFDLIIQGYTMYWRNTDFIGAFNSTFAQNKQDLAKIRQTKCQECLRLKSLEGLVSYTLFLRVNTLCSLQTREILY